jgi:YggT family protein
MFGLRDLLFTFARLLDIALNIYFWIVVIAVILSWIPLDPYHPTARSIVRFFRRATEPVFTFCRRALHLYRYSSPLDLTPIVVILAIFFLRIFLVQTIRDLAIAGDPVQFARFLLANFLLAILYTVYAILNMYLWIVVIAAILSWIPLDPYHPLAQAIVRFLRAMTDPVFTFFRRTLRLYRYISSFDFTPIIVIVLIYLFQQFLLRYLIQSVLNLHY